MKHLKLYLEFNHQSDKWGDYNPVGVFDSGYGGLFILTALRKKFPNWDFVFLGDNLTAPYGELDSSEVVSLTSRGIKVLDDFGCKTKIIACNTACSVYQDNDKNTVDIITPTIQWMKNINYEHLGVVATPKTIHIGYYQKSLERVTALSCPDWVELVESDTFMTEEGISVIKSDLEELFSLNNQIDTLLLACTHFIILKDVISKLYPDINIVSQDEIMCQWVSNLGLEPSLNGECKYLTTGNPDEFDIESMSLIGQKLKSERVTI